MRLPMMNIEYFYWKVIDPSDWISTLSSIRIGECVWSLPIIVSDGAAEIVFPLPRTGPIRHDVIDTSVMRFKRETYTDGLDTVDVWRRVE